MILLTDVDVAIFVYVYDFSQSIYLDKLWLKPV